MICARFIFYVSEKMDSNWLEESWYVYECDVFNTRGCLVKWCLIVASVDVDKIAKEVDFQALQANIINITFCNINSEVYA